MKVLITGGAGFIGSNVTKYFLDKGHEVIVLDNLSTGFIENLPNSHQLTFIKGDILEEASLKKAIKKCEVVLHLAAAVGNVRSVEEPQKDSSVNVIGTLKVLDTAKKEGVHKIVYSSSAGIFGELKKFPIDEDHPTAPDSPYGVSKLAGELHTLCYAKLYGFRSVCLRYFNVYGPHQRYDFYGNVIPIFATKKMRGEPLTVYGNGEQTRDFVNVLDIAQANYLAATTEAAHGTFNIGSGEAITINQLAQWMNEIDGTKPVPIHYKESRKGEVIHSLANIQKAKRELDYQPQWKLKEGLKAYWQWIQHVS